MRDEAVKLVIGGLLHDIGKVIYRQGADKRKHGQSGYEYLKEHILIDDKDILDCVRYHHADALKDADVSNDALAYIVYIADNIASAADRRYKMQEETGFEIHTSLQPIFNILNKNNKNMYYRASVLNPDGEINYPVNETEKFDEFQYNRILQNISDNLKGINWNTEYINSLLEVLEADLSFVPSSTSKKEVADISLYDHLKLTAAFSGCIYEYLRENGITDYRTELFKNGAEFYNKKVFMIASVDVSGIQNFIYTISTKNALKTLRSRSFYLEIMMEHIIDLLVQRLGLSRANLIYSGGGHCYMLLPDTENARNIFDEFMREINEWYMENFQISLYIAGGYIECSANELHNEPSGSYKNIFKNLSRQLSDKKINRYTSKDIIFLNNLKVKHYDRECNVCKRIGKVNDEGRCRICEDIESFSRNILQNEIFTVVKNERDEGLPLPCGYTLISDTEESLKSRMSNEEYVRAYGKNKMYTGKHIAAKLWVGDYANGGTFEEFASAAEGIERIAVLRADVDNLGHAIVAGFDNADNDNRYVSLSRTAALSRQLSLFFKLYINKILNNPEYIIYGDRKEKRNAAVVYSGGDDLFIVGAWNEVIELAVDIRKNFEKYTEGTLTISAGIGIYHDKYPISVIAEETAALENKSKNNIGKNSVTLFEDGCSHDEFINGNRVEISDGTYSWDEFENEVIADKFNVIKAFFDECDERGNSFLYKILELIRNQNDRINFARFVYLIARLEPDDNASEKKKNLYDVFLKKMYQWISESDKQKKNKNIRQLKTAINLYVYLKRTKEGESDDKRK